MVGWRGFGRVFFGCDRGREKINAECAEDAEVAEERNPRAQPGMAVPRETREGERKGGRQDAMVEILHAAKCAALRMTTAGWVG